MKLTLSNICPAGCWLQGLAALCVFKMMLMMTNKAAVSGSVLQFMLQPSVSVNQIDGIDSQLSCSCCSLESCLLQNHHSFTLTIKNVAMLQWCNASCDLLLYFILCNDTNDCFLCWNIRKVSALETLYLSIFQPLLRTKEPSRDEENTIRYNKAFTAITRGRIDIFN